MKLNDLEKTFLLKALKNHETGRRDPVHWRAAIRGRFDQTPGEISMDDDILAKGFTRASWLNFNSPQSDMAIRVHGALGILKAHLQSRHIKNLEWGQVDSISPEVFLALGYVFIPSRKIHVKLDAEARAEEWRGEGLDVFVFSELGQGADLYELNALEVIPKYKKVMDTGRLPFEQGGAIYGRPADCIRDKAEAKKAEEEINAAFGALEAEGLAVRVQGVRLCWDWRGIVLTREGVTVAETMRDRIKQQEKDAAKPKVGITYQVKCPACKRIMLETTDGFDPDRAVHGFMLNFLPEFQNKKWTLPFMPGDIGQGIVCPECDEPLVGYDNKLKSGVLVDPAEAQEPKDSGGKIDDKELLKLIDQGLSQVEIAEIFQVTKQAISKRLKGLREDDPE